MCVSYLPPPGDKIIDDLVIPKAKSVANSLDKLDYFFLQEVRRCSNTGSETLVFDTEVEVGQRFVHEIRPVERISVTFFPDDETLPEVLALREDFPEVPHLNLRLFEKPRSLCLFEEKYSEIKLRWTPVFFLERIREWLARTSLGELHAYDQPFEPLLIGTPDNIILPPDLFSEHSEGSVRPLIIRKADYGKLKITFFAEWKDEIPAQKAEELEFIPIIISGYPQNHGIIRKQPSSVADLQEFLLNAKIDLVSRLRTVIQEKHSKAKETGNCILNAKVILILNLPKISEESDREEMDILAFIINLSVREIGKEIGIWDVLHDGNVGTLLVPVIFPRKSGHTVKRH